VLRTNPLHRNQFAYQARKSTEAVLHNVVTENTEKHKKMALGPLLDIEGALIEPHLLQYHKLMKDMGWRPPS
jgi:hypothetical protein